MTPLTMFAKVPIEEIMKQICVTMESENIKQLPIELERERIKLQFLQTPSSQMEGNCMKLPVCSVIAELYLP